MASPSEDDDKLRSLSPHILPAAGAMIGVCATLVGLIKIVEGRSGKSDVDKYIGLTMILFLVSAFTSYIALRDGNASPVSVWLERVADWCFIVGLLGLTLITLLFAFETI